ncbi:MAG: hypothetical protein KatS3mg015_0014 [Fimbriimonadales bacterium]|nr:MAG: hypothetical protein KatS3mg015_0014 [Fimbriimonadales bacterium]
MEPDSLHFRLSGLRKALLGCLQFRFRFLSQSLRTFNGFLQHRHGRTLLLEFAFCVTDGSMEPAEALFVLGLERVGVLLNAPKVREPLFEHRLGADRSLMLRNRVLDPPSDLVETLFNRLQLRGEPVRLGALGLRRLVELFCLGTAELHGLFQLFDSLCEIVRLLDQHGRLDFPQHRDELLVPFGYFGLLAERLSLALDLVEHVCDSFEMSYGALQTFESVYLSGPVTLDAGGFVNPDSAFFGGRADCRVNVRLANDRVSGLAEPGVGEQFVDVSQTNRMTVDEVLALPVSAETSGHDDLAGVDRQLPLFVVKDEGDFGIPKRFALRGSREDDVGRLARAKILGAQFAQRPNDGVHDVAFSAAVGAYDGNEIAVYVNVHAVGERFETEDADALESHRSVVR